MSLLIYSLKNADKMKMINRFAIHVKRVIIQSKNMQLFDEFRHSIIDIRFMRSSQSIFIQFAQIGFKFSIANKYFSEIISRFDFRQSFFAFFLFQFSSQRLRKNKQLQISFFQRFFFKSSFFHPQYNL